MSNSESFILPILTVSLSTLTHRDFKKVGVTIVGPQKKIVSSLTTLETHSKNGPVPV